jgi:hypothetical protein
MQRLVLPENPSPRNKRQKCRFFEGFADTGEIIPELAAKHEKCLSSGVIQW